MELSLMDFLQTFPTTPTQRPSADAYFLAIAFLAATRGTCIRRRVGCVLVNERRHILATGYNGVARGRVHCISSPCAGSNFASGHGLDKCEAIHAEQNALLQCRDVYAVDTVFCTHSPCITCTKLLLNTGAKRIVFANEYPHAEARAMWMGDGRKWEKFEV